MISEHFINLRKNKAKKIKESPFLRPCPFCGSKDLKLRTYGGEFHSVICQSCGSSGSLYKDATQAVNAWNRRVTDEQPGA